MDLLLIMQQRCWVKFLLSAHATNAASKLRYAEIHVYCNSEHRTFELPVLKKPNLQFGTRKCGTKSNRRVHHRVTVCLHQFDVIVNKPLAC
jgi:hypothetical protein